MSAHALQLETPLGDTVPLQSVAIESTLVDLFAHTTLTQRFVNTEDWPIEAVYTFPTPHGAVFMGLEVTIGENRIVGVVMPDAQADRGYEEAIQDGNAAVLLREVEPGLYSVSVGNIGPGETIALKYSYAEQLGWQGNTLRLMLPTTIAPHYGNPAAIGLAPHEVCDHSIDAGYAFSLTVNVTGGLSQCAIASPSHSIQTSACYNGVCVTLATETASMDRDVVMTLTKNSAMSTLGIVAPNRNPKGVTTVDGGQWVASIGIYLPQPQSIRYRPGTYSLIIDCSGSMGGDSIQQARLAAKEIVSSLKAADLFNITAFGSHAENLFKQPTPVNAQTVEQAYEFIAGLGATYGGTEIGGAITTACPLRAGRSQNSNVLLITDGQVFDGNEIVSYHQHRGHRIFTLGVGASVSAGFLKALAASTGGACELVAPNEYMAQHIVRHFGRMRQQRVVGGEISWGSTPLWSVPGDLATVFAGDTLHVGAGFSQMPTGEVTLSVTYEDGSMQTLTTPLKAIAGDDPSAESLPRVLAHRRLPELSDTRRMALALDFQLLTEGTKCLMVHERDDTEKTDDLPALRSVPLNLPAGWGGTGRSMPRMRKMYDDNYDLPPAKAARSVGLCGASDSDVSQALPPFLRRKLEGRKLGDGGSSSKDSKTTGSQKAREKIAPALNTMHGNTGTAPLERLGITPVLLAKLAGSNIFTVAELLAIPRANWSSLPLITDADIAELLNALRRAGYKAA